MITFESYFLFNILFSFFVEFDVDGQIQPVRDLKLIAENYIKGQFIFELIPLLPLQFLPLDGDENRLYIVKLVRIINGIALLDPGKTYEILTLYNLKRIKKIIDKDIAQAESRDTD